LKISRVKIFAKCKRNCAKVNLKSRVIKSLSRQKWRLFQFEKFCVKIFAKCKRNCAKVNLKSRVIKSLSRQKLAAFFNFKSSASAFQ